MRSLVEEAVEIALKDAAVPVEKIEQAYVGNALAGLMTGQESVRGQAFLRNTGVQGIPVINVDNACASSSTALGLACSAILAGQADCILVVGAERLYSPDRQRTVQALAGATEKDENAGPEAGQQSPFMEIYAGRVRNYMAKYDLQPWHLAWIAAKNHRHAVHNPFAQYREAVTPEQVLASPVIAQPLTRLMCSPITDGASAVVVVSEKFARRMGGSPVRVLASTLVSGHPGVDPDNEAVLYRAAAKAYAQAGLGPQDVQVAEVHDAAASGELLAYSGLNFCEAGGEMALIEQGVTALGGRLPVNPSGGLVSKGNPSGATGLGQITELVWQLRGVAGGRQVAGARVALAENAGGTVADRTAAVCLHILSI
jgi:acetyl-CoA acetyltransferase